MNRRSLINTFCFSLACFSFLSVSLANSEKINADVYNNTPAAKLKFLENKGQITDTKGNPVPFVFFKASFENMEVYLTDKGLTYVFVKTNEEEEIKSSLFYDSLPTHKTRGTKTEIAWINMLLSGAIIKEENIIKQDPTSQLYNFFYPHCPEGIYGVKEYSKIIVKEIYPGIDWVLYPGNSKIKYDFIVHPGANTEKIKLVYESEHPATLDAEGNIQIETSLGLFKEQMPICYLNKNRKKGPESIFKLKQESPHHVSAVFKIKHYSSKDTLVIDPQLWWGTFYGGASIDKAAGVFCDLNDNVFIAGRTTSIGFPVQNTGTYFDNSLGGLEDIFILKFTNSGALLWATYYGGSGFDAVEHGGISTDSNGNLFLSGLSSSADFPVQSSGLAYFDNSLDGPSDIIIMKFNNNGGRLWATYYGGSSGENGAAICTDINNNVFVTGITTSADFPVQPFGTAYFDDILGANHDAFIMRFDNSLQLNWATYYGGTGYDVGYGLCTDLNGNVYVMGQTACGDFPVLSSGEYLDPSFGGSFDIFIIEFNNLGNRLWSTYCGGNGLDAAEYNSICTDANGNLFLTFLTGSSNCPVKNAGTYFDNSLQGAVDAFVAKFDSQNKLLWGTYYGIGPTFGGWGSSNAVHIDIDACGNIYTIHHAESSSNFFAPFPSCIPGFNDSTLSGKSNMFISKFDNNGDLLWGTYFGGDGEDLWGYVAIDSKNDIFIVYAPNPVSSSSYPLKDPGNGTYFDPSWNQSVDLFIAKFVNLPPLSIAASSAPSASCLCSGVAIIETSALCPYSLTWNDNLWNYLGNKDTLRDLCPGKYYAIVKDNLECFDDTIIVIIPSFDTMIVAPSVAHATCISLGTISPNVTGGALPYSYYWNTIPAQSTLSATGLTQGNYVLTVTDSTGCANSFTVAVSLIDSLNAIATGDSSICLGEEMILTALGGTNYYWSTGETTASITSYPNSNTTYSVIVTRGICVDTAYTPVEVFPLPLASSTTDTTILRGQSITLSASGGSTYSWQPNTGCGTCSDIIVAPAITTTYIVTITDQNGCVTTDTIIVNVEYKCKAGDIYIPNAFSPNKDGENDFLQVFSAATTANFYIIIYNRWGEKVFESRDPDFTWNGTYKNKELDTGVYTYILNLVCDESNKETLLKGNISLVK